MDVFSWSMPFLAEKVVSMLYTIVKKGCDDEGDDVNIKTLLSKDPSKMTRKTALFNFKFLIAEEAKQSRGLIMKGKVRSVARMNKMFSTLR